MIYTDFIKLVFITAVVLGFFSFFWGGGLYQRTTHQAGKAYDPPGKQTNLNQIFAEGNP